MLCGQYRFETNLEARHRSGSGMDCTAAASTVCRKRSNEVYEYSGIGRACAGMMHGHAKICSLLFQCSQLPSLSSFRTRSIEDERKLARCAPSVIRTILV